MTDVIIDALLDALKVLPFLFGAYLLIEYLEHKAGGKMTDRLRHLGPAGPLAGALLGAVPQCGFSVTAANFYSGRLISVGTLVAVFLSTSDEAVPILLAEPQAFSHVIKLLGVKLIIAFAAGLGADLLYRLFGKKQEEPFADLCRHCHCEHGNIWRSALHHTIRIFLFLLAINLLLGLGLYFIGDEAVGRIFLENSFWQPFLTALLGFVPNCAASVLITKLYLNGALSFGSAVAGLCTGAGLGLAVLLKTNHRPKENALIVVGLYAVAVAAGLLLNAIGIL